MLCYSAPKRKFASMCVRTSPVDARAVGRVRRVCALVRPRSYSSERALSCAHPPFRVCSLMSARRFSLRVSERACASARAFAVRCVLVRGLVRARLACALGWLRGCSVEWFVWFVGWLVACVRACECGRFAVPRQTTASESLVCVFQLAS
eukprot:3244421-Pleurochrysis_carterae.AAC.1